MYTTIASFLLGITGSIVGRVLFVLGFGLVSYASLTTLTSNLIDTAMTNYNAINSTVLQILNLGGVGQSLGIITSAMTSRAALSAIKKLQPK